MIANTPWELIAVIVIILGILTYQLSWQRKLLKDPTGKPSGNYADNTTEPDKKLVREWKKWQWYAKLVVWLVISIGLLLAIYFFLPPDLRFWEDERLRLLRENWVGLAAVGLLLALLVRLWFFPKKSKKKKPGEDDFEEVNWVAVFAPIVGLIIFHFFVWQLYPELLAQYVADGGPIGFLYLSALMIGVAIAYFPKGWKWVALVVALLLVGPIYQALPIAYKENIRDFSPWMESQSEREEVFCLRARNLITGHLGVVELAPGEATCIVHDYQGTYLKWTVLAGDENTLRCEHQLGDRQVWRPGLPTFGAYVIRIWATTEPVTLEMWRRQGTPPPTNRGC